MNGAIIHEITVVSPQVEQGRGLVPAKINPVTGKAMLTASGEPLLDYDMATPNMLLHFFPTGILGLGLTALLASFMSGMAGNVTAFNTVFTYDLYQCYIHKKGSDRHYMAVGRLATVGGILLSIGTAYAAINFNNIMDTLQLVFSFVNAPLFATFLLGMFWKRATGHGALRADCGDCGGDAASRADAAASRRGAGFTGDGSRCCITIRAIWRRISGQRSLLSASILL